MTPREMILHRKSVRSYTDRKVSDQLLAEIRARISTLQPLYPHIAVRAEIVERSSVRCICPWATPQLLSVFSEEKEGWLENVGFLFQQLELDLQSRGLGVCWLGLGQLNRQGQQETARKDGLRFAIMLAFGYPKGQQLRQSPAEFRRKPLSAISDIEDPRLECARLAPSSVNSQPWYFTHDGDTIHVYCARKGLLSAAIGDMNRIDMGIALSHLYVTNPETFRFFQSDAPQLKGYQYLGSVTL